jgi:hypothetical protein
VLNLPKAKMADILLPIGWGRRVLKASFQAGTFLVVRTRFTHVRKQMAATPPGALSFDVQGCPPLLHVTSFVQLSCSIAERNDQPGILLENSLVAQNGRVCSIFIRSCSL